MFIFLIELCQPNRWTRNIHRVGTVLQQRTPQPEYHDQSSFHCPYCDVKKRIFSSLHSVKSHFKNAKINTRGIHLILNRHEVNHYIPENQIRLPPHQQPTPAHSQVILVIQKQWRKNWLSLESGQMS